MIKPKHALITGVSSGIGLAITQKLLNEGWQVSGLSRREIKLDHANFRHYAVDLADISALNLVLAEIIHIDALVHAAGIMKAAPIGQLSLTDGAELWHLHVTVSQVLANHAAHALSDEGRIVLLGSRTSNGAPGRSQYVATKSALVGMVRSWAAELISRKITVNIVAPGATDTPMLNDPARASSQPKLPPLGRFIQPEEVADLVNYLLSPSAAAITGQQLVICGGGSL